MSEVAQYEPRPGQSVANPTPAHMLQTAIERGVDMAQLERLMDLQERWEANEGRKAFVQAMSRFKANPPKVVKDKLVSFSGTRYTHASLAAVVDAVVQGLGEHGLSHRWDVEQNGNAITVTCVLTHELGHSERTSMTAPPDDSGKKNTIQQVASTITYLERYTLMAATGLAAKDMDDDGRTASTAPSQQEPTADEGLMADLWSKAEEGWPALQQAWKSLSESQRTSVGVAFRDLKKKAQEVSGAAR